MKFAGIVITYFPDLEELKKNIQSYIDELDVLILWENTPDSQKTYRPEDLKNISSKIIIQTQNENIGIGKALNQGAEWMLSNGYDYLVTLDQDSFFNPGELGEYKKMITGTTEKHIGVFGTNYISNGRYAYERGEGFLYVNECITSGSVFPKLLFEKGVFFDEKMFIDAVDFEYCYRVYKQLGLKTAIAKSIALNHKIGYSAESFLSRISDNYSAFRTYYLVRNQIRIWKDYPKLFGFCRKKHLVLKYILLRYVSIVGFEKDKKNKLKSLSKGIYDGCYKNF